jgi:O-antigen ligase
MAMEKYNRQISSPAVQESVLEIWRNRLGIILVDKILPVGIFVLLTGMLWVGDHGYYSKLFYWFVVLPAVVLITIQPASLKHMLSSRIVVAYMLFACYMSLSIFWSTTGDAAIDLIKRPLYVLLLFFSVFELGQIRSERLRLTVKMSAICAIVAAFVTVVRFFIEGAHGHGRLAGYGALNNPLLVSHVFGFFIALWFGLFFTGHKLFQPLPVLGILVCGVLLIATGSRTPLVAMMVTICWLAALSANNKAFIALCGLFFLGAGTLLYAPDMIMQRGLSYRTEIWANALMQISERVWFGHGYAAPLSIQLESIPYPFSDPHNLSLRVLYDGGVFGLVLWLLLYVLALERSWQLRSDKWVLICSATVVYGLAAGMTEGGSFLARPEEHWFLIWIPLALLSATTYRGRADGQAK